MPFRLGMLCSLQFFPLHCLLTRKFHFLIETYRNNYPEIIAGRFTTGNRNIKIANF